MDTAARGPPHERLHGQRHLSGAVRAVPHHRSGGEVTAVCPRGWRPEGTATWQRANPLGKWMRRPQAQCQFCWGAGYILELTAFGALLPVICGQCKTGGRGK